MTGRLFRLSIIAALCAAVSVAHGQSREARRQGPEPEPYVPQTEPTNLDEGKTAAQIFSQSCAVCHERGQGLTKRLRSASALRPFLRQHYTIGIEQAEMLANYLASSAVAAREAAPARTTPAERVAAPARPPLPSPEPSTASRRPAGPGKPEKPDETRKPETAVAATRPARRDRSEEPRPAETVIQLPSVEPAAPDVQTQIERAVAEAAERAAATPLTERLPAPDPARVQEIPL